MVYQGTIQNCVVVFAGPIQLPEGTPVRVEAVHKPVDSRGKAPTDALVEMSDLAIETGIPELAANADHYLYGYPKADHGS